MPQKAPTLTEFNQQVSQLLTQYGEQAFAAAQGQYPEYTLFVEEDRVIAEPRTSPRHRYGAFCELPKALDAQQTAARVQRWVASGEAYERFVGMNVCRYC